MPRAEGMRWSQRVPSRWISPSLTSSRPAIIRRSVDFPQPDGPTKTVNEPSSTARSMPWMTSTAWKLLRTRRSSSLATRIHSDDDAIAGLEPAKAAENDRVTLPLRWAPVNRGSTLQRRQADARDGKLAALDGQRRRRAVEGDLAPAAARRPEVDAIASAGGMEADLAFALVEDEAAIGVDQRVARQRPGVVAAAFDVVPGIAARAVVTGTRRPNDGQPLIDEAALDEMRGHHVF